MFLKDPLIPIRNIFKYTDQAVLDKCPDCGNPKLYYCRASGRGIGGPDKEGLHCEKCRVMWFKK